MTPRSASSFARSRRRRGRPPARAGSRPQVLDHAFGRAPRRGGGHRRGSRSCDHGAHRAGARAELDDDRRARPSGTTAASTAASRAELGTTAPIVPGAAGGAGRRGARTASAVGRPRFGRHELPPAAQFDVRTVALGGGHRPAPATAAGRRAAVRAARAARSRTAASAAAAPAARTGAVQGEPGRGPVAAATEPRWPPRHVDRALRSAARPIHRRSPTCLSTTRDLGLGGGAHHVDDAVDLLGAGSGRRRRRARSCARARARRRPPAPARARSQRAGRARRARRTDGCPSAAAPAGSARRPPRPARPPAGGRLARRVRKPRVSVTRPA